MPQPDLVAHTRALADKYSQHDPRKIVIEQCPCLVAWLREWREATGAKAKLLRATFDNREIYRA